MFEFKSLLFQGDALLQAIADDQHGPGGQLTRISRTQNATDPAVKKVQEALLNWRADALPQFGADGEFGSEMGKAIRRFKSEELHVPAAEIIEDVGPLTVQRLDAIRAAAETPPTPRPHFDVNLILVGHDGFTAGQLTRVDKVVERVRTLFAQNLLPIGTVNRFQLALSEVGALVVPRSEADLAEIARRWAVPNEAMDVFMVPRIAVPGFVAGQSPIPGSCDKADTSREPRTPVVSLRETVAESAGVFMHEVGHCLKLQHCHITPALCGPNNVMEAFGAAGTAFTSQQVEIMRQRCYVKP